MLVTLFIFFFSALGAHLYLHPAEQHLFFGINETAKISCLLPESSPQFGHTVCWYRKRREEPLTSVQCCNDNGSVYHYSCASEWRSATLEIRNVQRNDSGVYYCALLLSIKLDFPTGSTLIVGDSFTARTSVLLVIPSPQQGVLERSVPLACVASAVSGQVWFSWNISGVPGLGQVSSIRDRDGSWTFINHIRISPDAWTRGEVTCEVQFNSSHTGEKRTVGYKEISTGDLGWCVTPCVVVALLLLCTVSFTIKRACQRSAAGTQLTPGATPVATAAVAQDGIVYALLDFETEKLKQKTTRRPKEGKKE